MSHPSSLDRLAIATEVRNELYERGMKAKRFIHECALEAIFSEKVPPDAVMRELGFKPKPMRSRSRFSSMLYGDIIGDDIEDDFNFDDGREQFAARVGEWAKQFVIDNWPEQEGES